MVSAAQIDEWLQATEDEHLELKEAQSRFDFEKLVRYCAALANEGGGHIVLGISDKRPRAVVSTNAFPDLERTKAGIIERLHIRVDAEEVRHPAGRVLVFAVPPRPIGLPIQHKGAYWMRGGEDLIPMTADRLKAIFAEAQPDFSAERCPGASLQDLDSRAVERFRRMWVSRSGNRSLKGYAPERLLGDAELIVDGGVTYAALILLGTHKALGRHLAQAEVIFEYRSRDESIAYQQRIEHRRGFFLFHDELWDTINLRNEVFQYQDGLYRKEVPAFNEAATREAVLNAVSHRDYRLAGSVFVRQYSSRIEIVSPGSLPPGITPENILWRQAPRNRRVAEALARCGLVERSGQGADRMFEACIREGKQPPDFTGTDAHQVALALHGKVRDPLFLKFLELVSRETGEAFSTDDLVVLSAVLDSRTFPQQLRPRLDLLVERGVVERVGRGRGVRHLLARGFYQLSGQEGVYTRKRGLDRETNKALLLKHIRDSSATGSQLNELMQVLPAQSRDQVQTLLRELKRDGQAHTVGQTRSARWYPGSGVKGEPR